MRVGKNGNFVFEIILVSAEKVKAPTNNKIRPWLQFLIPKLGFGRRQFWILKNTIFTGYGEEFYAYYLWNSLGFFTASLTAHILVNGLLYDTSSVTGG